MRLFPQWAVAAVLVSLTSAKQVVAQGSGCPEAKEYPCGEVPKHTPDEARAILLRLRTDAPDWFGEILRDFFGEAYGPRFVDWVVYIGSDQTGKPIIRQSLLSDNKFVRGNLLRGRQALSIIVFSDATLAVPAPKVDRAAQRAEAMRTTADQVTLIGKQCQEAKVACTVSLAAPSTDSPKGGAAADTTTDLTRTTLQFTRDPALTAFLKSISKGIVGDGAGAPAAVIPDSLINLTLIDVVRRDSPTPDTTVHLWFGMRRIALPNNALARYTIRPHLAGIGFDFPTATSVSRTVENASASRFGASLALGLTGFAPDTTFGISTDSTAIVTKSISGKAKPNVWVLAHLYLARPQLPIRPTSFSVVAGTNIGVSDLFRDLLVGVSVDRLLGDIGIAGGCNFIERQNAVITDSLGAKLKQLRSKSYRKCKPFVGLDFAF